MDIPKVCIVGRPNVGKSTLFNALARKRLAVVDSIAGTTRDSVSLYIHHKGVLFEFVDTGGIVDNINDPFNTMVQKQVELAISTANLIIFVVDVRTGITPIDKTIANRIRKSKAKVLVVANKADNMKFEMEAYEFHGLGFGEPFVMSAIQKLGSTELLDKVSEFLAEFQQPDDVYKDILKIAFIGRRNAGKSTLMNMIAGEERSIASEIPGTTRDAINILIERNGKKLLLVDTPGLRKKWKFDSSAEYFSKYRAEKAVRFADVVFFMIDATGPIATVDKKIAEFLDNQFKPCVIVLNKWDLAPKGMTPDSFIKYFEKHMPRLLFAPISSMSALTGLNVDATIRLAYALKKQTDTRVTTGQLNKIIEASIARYAPFAMTRTEPKIYYGTQIEVSPPTIVLSVNRPDIFSADYKKYIYNKLRAALPFSEVPFRLLFKKATGKS